MFSDKKNEQYVSVKSSDSEKSSGFFSLVDSLFFSSAEKPTPSALVAPTPPARDRVTAAPLDFPQNSPVKKEPVDQLCEKRIHYGTFSK